MPHILLIFAANKLVQQVTFFLTSIHQINNIYAHQKYITLHGIEPRAPKGYTWNYKHNYHHTNTPYFCSFLYAI